MEMRYLLLVVLSVVLLITLTEARNKRKVNKKEARRCGEERCGSGKRCATRYDGVKTCVCRQKCRSNQYLVCGSDGNTYTNYCHLHRAACLDNKHVHVLHTGPCLIEFNEVQRDVERKSVEKRKRPLVCYQVQRDELRQLLVDLLKNRVVEGKPYSEIVDETFGVCDFNNDQHLDGDEMLRCTERNVNETDSSLHILRGLCMDALISMGDEDEDWILSREEFMHIFGVGFVPPTGYCSLENRNYTDGAETKLDCNVCVCACGNWVCTGAPCYKGKEMGVPGPVIEGKIPGKEETEELLRGFKASEDVDVTKVDEEVRDEQMKDEIVQQINEYDEHKKTNM